MLSSSLPLGVEHRGSILKITDYLKKYRMMTFIGLAIMARPLIYRPRYGRGKKGKGAG